MCHSIIWCSPGHPIPFQNLREVWSTMDDFVTTLYGNLTNSTIDMSSFQFSSLVFFTVTASIFDGVKNECGMDVLQTVMEFADLLMKDIILLANFMLP